MEINIQIKTNINIVIKLKFKLKFKFKFIFSLITIYNSGHDSDPRSALEDADGGRSASTVSWQLPRL